MARLYRRGRIWWTWYYDDAGRRCRASTRCTDRRAAEVVARRYERDGAANRDAAEDQATLEQACELFRVDRRNRGRSPATLSYYKPKLGHLLRLMGRELLLDEIDSALVDDFIATRLDEGASRSTVAKELGALRGVLRLGVRRGYYRTDPSYVLPEGWSAGYVPRSLSLSLEQADALILALRPDRAGHVAFILASGSSLGPSTRARRSDIDLGRGLIRVRGSKTETRRRVVPIFDHVQHFAQRAHQAAAKNGPAYAPWTNIRRDLALACERAGVPRCSPNDLRRSFATWLVERGAPSNLVGYALGHQDSRMVERVYGRVDGSALARAFSAVGVGSGASRCHNSGTVSG